MERMWVAAGGVAGCTAVAMAAAAAHALSHRLDPRALEAVRSAVQMQGWHAIALVLVGIWLGRRLGSSAALLANLAGAAFALGVLLFCGSVYAGELAGIRIGPTAPVGGILLMAGWLLLAASAMRA